MHVQTHLMCGWCLGNGFTLTPRERLFCVLASIVPDLDGMGRIYSEQSYFRWHHVAGHNMLFAIVTSATFTMFSSHRRKAFLLYLGLFHLHLVMDFLGSGPGWGIMYFWPLSNWSAINPYAWPFFSWENVSIALVFFAWMMSIAIYDGRTPLELLMPSLDQQLVAFARKYVPFVPRYRPLPRAEQ